MRTRLSARLLCLILRNPPHLIGDYLQSYLDRECYDVEKGAALKETGLVRGHSVSSWYPARLRWIFMALPSRSRVSRIPWPCSNNMHYNLKN